MGVKDLWSILTPYCERKPICELRGKIVAIDLAGWVCESLNVVDYFVHPRHHLKNLFFRTCYLIWEEVTPVFVLEGTAPKLKSQVIAKRNEIQFRGVKPKEKPDSQSPTETVSQTNKKVDGEKGRTRFNHVLKQCENLLLSMGIQCVQGPGEAEAYCAFLNKKGLVDGVISQDSDCFAYGAVTVYRNFSVSTQGAQAAQGGAVDIYDMNDIRQQMDFGQNKIIVMALLCGCDYCPDGIGGVGRDGVIKLFNKYKNHEVLDRVRSWRTENSKYSALEMRVDDKTICSNCGHIGRTQTHTKNGCGVCRTKRGCDESLWKEERLSLKAELALRKKALLDPAFPSEDVIKEFLTEPKGLPSMNLNWRQPNIVKFIKQVGHLLQWPEIYCFQKFFPILTRWQIKHAKHFESSRGTLAYVVPKQIVKKRLVKGTPSLEVLWEDEKGFFEGLIPDEQLHEFEKDHPKGLQELWSTIEPVSMLEEAFPHLVESFFKAKEKPKKAAKEPKARAAKKTASKAKSKDQALGSLDSMSDLITATEDVAKTIKPRAKPSSRKPLQPKKGLQMIDKFFKKNIEQAMTGFGGLGTPHKTNHQPAYQVQCSTPVTKVLPSDLESDADDDNAMNLSAIINGLIMKKPCEVALNSHGGRQLLYESVSHSPKERTLDDLDLLVEQRRLSTRRSSLKKIESLDDTFDLLVAKSSNKVQLLINKSVHLLPTPSRQSSRNALDFSRVNADEDKENSRNFSYFFQPIGGVEACEANDGHDEFEKLMDLNCSKRFGGENPSNSSSEECIVLDDSD